MKSAKRILIFIVGVSILGLALFGLRSAGALAFSPSGSQGIGFDDLPPGSTATATPFQPLNSTATYLPTNYPTSTPTKTPKPQKIVPISNTKGVDPIEEPEGQINIMLLGSDMKYKGQIGRTDTIILLSINTRSNTVSVTSIPRDLYVYIPGWTDQRINTAFAHGGFPLLAQTMLHNFGVQPDYFILVNLWAFETFINDLGGIYVNVPRGLCDDKWGGGLSHCVSAGRQHFYGREALWYVRSRVTTNDFDRNVRQQIVLSSILDRLFSLNTISKIPQLYDNYTSNITTNLDLATMLSLSPTAAKLSDRSRITQYYINQDAVTDWTTSSGAQVLLPDFQMIRSLFSAALNSPEG